MPRLVSCLLLPLLATALPVIADPMPDAAPTAAASAASGYSFVGYQEDTGVGSRAEVVFLPKGVTNPEDDSAKVVVEIPQPTQKLTAIKRAQTIAARLQEMSQADNKFYNNLTPDKWNNQTVIRVSDSPDSNSYLITVDPASAKAWQKMFNMSDGSAVAYLLKTFKERLQGKLRDAKFDFQLTDQEKLERANDYRRQADEARHKKEDVREVALLKEGIRMVPSYGALYAQLAAFYLQKNDSRSAKMVVAQAKQNNVDLSDVIRTLDPSGSNAVLTLVAQAGN